MGFDLEDDTLRSKTEELKRLKNIIENPGALTLIFIFSGTDSGTIKSAEKLEKDIGISIGVSCFLESILKNQKEKDIRKKRK